MFVARRPFRNYNQMVLPGSIVEPGSTKWFKTRLKDGKIVEINAHNFDEWSKYFEAKFGVTLKHPDAAAEDSDVCEDTDDVDEDSDVPGVDESNTEDNKAEPARVVKVVV